MALPTRTFLAVTDGSRAKKALAVAHTKEIRIKLRSPLNYNHQFIILISCQARVNRPTFFCDAQPEIVLLEVPLESHHQPWHFQVFGTSATRAHDMFKHKPRHPLGLRLYFWQQRHGGGLGLPVCYFLLNYQVRAEDKTALTPLQAQSSEH